MKIPRYNYIAIFGQKNNGKSTFAELLQQALHSHCRYSVSSLAKPLKEVVNDIFGVSSSLYKNSPNPPPGWNRTMRECLQWLGDGARQFDPNIWTTTFFANHGPATICDDGRYKSDFDSFKEWGGFNVLIVNPKELVTNASHPSESWIGEQAFFNLALQTSHDPSTVYDYSPYDVWDKVIINNGTVSDLALEASALAVELIAKWG